MNIPTNYHAAIYCRLSKDDDQSGESVSIGTQRAILEDYCREQGYPIYKVYTDDGYSGTNFNRPGFQELLDDVEQGTVNLVITKDLSRLGRDYIMTGYYSEIYFPSKGVRYIAVADNFDSLKNDNDIAPFKNILNDMYARDISRKIKNAKRQRAKNGLQRLAQPPYGYRMNPDTPSRLIIDPEPAEVVRLIFSLTLEGMGQIAITKELAARKIVAPSVYKHRQGDSRFSGYGPVTDGDPYRWSSATIGSILRNPVYTGDLILLKTEIVNHKTGRSAVVPEDRRVVIPNAHEPIISREIFNHAAKIRAEHHCPARMGRENLFRGLLFCDCCGHPLTLSRKKLKDREVDIYLCTHHNRRPDECPKTHIIYHEVLYPYVLEQIRALARSMKRRKVTLPFSRYTDIQLLTPDVLRNTVKRIEVSHSRKRQATSRSVRIEWNLQ
jgi:DNA invertase Pin-like site-specific DNA recombinase